MKGPKTKMPKRESSIYPLLLTGASVAEIAQIVGISYHAAAVTVGRICTRFGVHGRVQLMARHIAELQEKALTA